MSVRHHVHRPNSACNSSTTGLQQINVTVTANRGKGETGDGHDLQAEDEQ